MFGENFRSEVLKYTKAIRENEVNLERSTSKIVELYPTREDLDRQRGSICIYYLETKSESTILSWIAYQELKKELIGNRRCMKNQTMEERVIMAKGLRIDKWMNNKYKHLRFKCFNKFSDKPMAEQVDIIYEKIISKAFPESRKRIV